ncbi:MAG: leucine-rich repeat domain-containing protein [Treponema sp.]|jgi:hypothetical protein|nr:leucine-rich repeat domain-containing protein [Treponema sp.]
MKTKTTVLFSAVFFLLAAVTWAQTNDFKYDLNAAGDGVVIKKYVGSVPKVVIPGTIEGYPVTEIGAEAFKLLDITEVVIPNSVTAIGNDAFAWCTVLTRVTLPGKLLTLGDKAFEHCEKLGAVNLPNTLTSIGEGAFSGCALAAVTIPASVTSIGSEAFKECGKLAALTFAAGSKLETIGAKAFQGTVLSAVTIPASVTRIDVAAFNTGTLKTVTFAQGSLCTTIEGGAFAYTALAEITIPESVTEIGSIAFKGCEFLTKVTMPAHPITYKYNEVFEECPRLTLASRKAITDTGYTGKF